MILQRLVDRVRESPDAARNGALRQKIEQMLVGPAGADCDTRRRSLQQALHNLGAVGLVKNEGMFIKLTTTGRDRHADLTPLWQAICGQNLDDRQEKILRLVNRLSEKSVAGLPLLETLKRPDFLNEVELESEDWLSAALYRLNSLDLIAMAEFAGKNFDVQATYMGLVWESRRAFTVESRFIDDLVAEWETTSVDFKREVHTGRQTRRPS